MAKFPIVIMASTCWGLFNLKIKWYLYGNKLSPEGDHALHFREFNQRLAHKFEPFQIFRFSQNSYTQKSQDCFKDLQDYFICNYCLLVVTETVARVDYEMQDFATPIVSMERLPLSAMAGNQLWTRYNKTAAFFRGAYLYISSRTNTKAKYRKSFAL